MATEKNDFYFEGTVKWLTNFKSAEYGNYNFLFYPKDAETRKAVKATGIRNNTKEDDQGFFYTFRSNEPFTVLDADGSFLSDAEGKLSKRVGNGSSVKMKFTVEKFDSAKFGRVTRGKVDSVMITNLIEYVPANPVNDTKDTAVPA